MDTNTHTDNVRIRIASVTTVARANHCGRETLASANSKLTLNFHGHVSYVSGTTLWIQPLGVELAALATLRHITRCVQPQL